MFLTLYLDSRTVRPRHRFFHLMFAGCLLAAFSWLSIVAVGECESMGELADIVAEMD